MECKYSKYVDGYIKGELKDELKIQLLEHARGCRECSRKLNIIGSLDKTIVESLRDIPYTSRRSEIISAAESANKIPLRRIFYRCRKYLYAAVLIIALVLSSTISYKLIYKFKKAISYTDGPISKVLQLQEQHVTSLFPKYTNFIIHDGYYYVPTGDDIGREKIGKLLGTVKSAVYITGNKLFLEEGDSALYNYSNKYYSIKGVSDNVKIACEDRQSLKSPAASFIVLERKEQFKAPDTEYLFSAKADEKECGIAIKNIAKYIPFFYTFNTDELKPFIVYVQSETGNADEKENGTGYILLNYVVDSSNREDTSKWVYLRISEGKHNLSDLSEFSYVPDPVILSFELNGIKWRGYKGASGNDLYFKGEKDDVVYEVSTEGMDIEKVRQYLNSFARPAES